MVRFKTRDGQVKEMLLDECIPVTKKKPSVSTCEKT